MKVQLENVKPMDIEKRSFEIITEELGDKKLIPGTELIVKRCIHTSADFDYADNLCFSPDAVRKAMEAIRNGACIVTDTQMAKAGINKRALARYGGEVYCFMSDEDVAKIAKENGTTRATASMDKAASLDKKLIFHQTIQKFHNMHDPLQKSFFHPQVLHKLQKYHFHFLIYMQYVLPVQVFPRHLAYS